jgi:endonuclease G
VPLPTLTERGGKRVSRDQTRPHDDDAHVLKYHHFSVVMNSERRMAFYAACNTTRDPALMGKKSRSELNGGSKDKWILDPRIPAMHQIETRELYGPLIFDRGHLVRREDVYWGESERLAEYGNFDSFHYTNCTPQHPEYNQSSQDGLWGELENHIADEAELDGLRLCIFAGPVFGRRDRRMLGVRIPGEFWKVVFAVRAGGALGAWGFALSQKALVAGAPAAPGEERFTPGAFDTHQLSLAAIEARTDVRFDARLHQADVYAHEGPGVERLVPGLESIRLS